MTNMYTRMNEGELLFCPTTLSSVLFLLPEVQFVKLRIRGGPRWDGVGHPAAQDSCRKLCKIKCMKKYDRRPHLLSLSLSLAHPLFFVPSAHFLMRQNLPFNSKGTNLTFLRESASEEFFDLNRGGFFFLSIYLSYLWCLLKNLGSESGPESASTPPK